MRILLLGATGFVGERLLDHLCQFPDLEITALVHRQQPSGLRSGVRYVSMGFENIDLHFLREENFDFIFHIARIPGRRFGNLGRYYAGFKGYVANKKLLNNINRLEKPPKLIYLSGSLMYGHNPGIEVSENAMLNPVGFGKYYYYAEKPLLDALRSGKDVMMLRAPWIIGNGSWFNQLYVDSIERNSTLSVYGNEGRLMSVITVEDCAGMIWYYAQNAAYASVYNIYTFKLAYAAFIHTVQEVYGKGIQIVKYGVADLKKMDKTTRESICSEIVLRTEHTSLINSYQCKFPDLEEYIYQLKNGHAVANTAAR